MLTNKDRKFLKSKAHHLKPIIIIGKDEVSSSAIKSINDAVDAHELIKIKFNHHKERKREIIDNINSQIETQLIGIIGNIAIIFRQNKDIKNRKYFID